MKKLYLVDIEGTIVTDKSYAPIEGAVEWLNSFHSSPNEFVLVSNNTSHKQHRPELVEKGRGQKLFRARRCPTERVPE
jgi:ribonucleotide monophosphatase NagD (HAD superfamily)